MKIAYVRPERVDVDAVDGGDIYHRKLLGQLRRHAETVDEVFVPAGRRRNRLPLWSQRIPPETHERIDALAGAGYAIIVSHENILSLASHSAARGCPTFLVIQNYFPRFRFAGRPLLSLAYRLGARRYYESAFAVSRGAVFVGTNDFEAAASRHAHAPERAVRFLLAQIPPAPMTVDFAFDATLMHTAGSDAWLPKRLSRLSDAERETLSARMTTGEYADHPRSGFTLITDRFDVGFKLKLMQALHVGDFILSRVDLGNEIRAISPDYRWFRTYETFEEMLDITADPAVHAAMRSDERAELARGVSERFTWERHGDEVFAMLERGANA